MATKAGADVSQTMKTLSAWIGRADDCDGTVTFKSAHDYRRMRDPRIAKLKSRVELIGSPEMTDPLRLIVKQPTPACEVYLSDVLPRERSSRPHHRPQGRLMRAAVTFVALLASHAAAVAQDYPARPIRLIVPYAAGGNGDILGRVVAEKLGDGLGRQVVVDNRPGANGIIGTELCAKAPPDGYTLAFVGPGHATNPMQYARIPFDPIRDFDAVGLAATAPLLVTVTMALPVKSISDLVAYARAHPGTLTYGTAGAGSSGHLAAILFTTLGGIEVVHVPYKGLTQATTDLVGGRIQLMFPSITSALPHVRSGRMRALAITSAKRSSLMPELPTVADAGVPGYEMEIWNGMLAPAHTPARLIARLNAQLRAYAEASDVKARLAGIGAEAAYSTPAAFHAFLEREIARWRKVLRDTGIRPE